MLRLYRSGMFIYLSEVIENTVVRYWLSFVDLCYSRLVDISCSEHNSTLHPSYLQNEL